MKGSLSKRKRMERNEDQDKLDHPILEFRFSKIAKKYLKSDFTIEVLACIPLLIYESTHLFSIN